MPFDESTHGRESAARRSAVHLADRLFGTDEDVGCPERWLGRYLILTCALALVMFARRPDALLNPQFWGEDGSIYFREQLILGFWGALHKMWNGFPYVLQRLVALLATCAPVAFAPLIYNVCAMIMTAFAAATFSLPGFRHLVRSDLVRAVVCVALVCVPSGEELVATSTNISWWLGPWLALVAVVRVPRSGAGVAAWCLAAALAVGSAPLAPVVVPLWMLRAVLAIRGDRRRELVFALAPLAALVAVIGTTGMLGAGDPLQADGSLVIAKTGEYNQWEPSHVWPALEVLPYVAAWVVDVAAIPASVRPTHTSGTLEVVAPALLLAAGVGLAFRNLSERGRTTVGYALYLFVSSLALTLVGRHALVRGFQGLVPNLNEVNILFYRYRAMPNAALLLAVAGIIDGARRRRTRAAAIVVACVGALAWAPEFRIPPLLDEHWPQWAARLDQKLASGSREPLIIPINPYRYAIMFDLPARGGTEPPERRTD